MTDDLGLSLQVSADPGDVYATAFALVFVALLTGIILTATGVRSTASLPLLAVLAVATVAVAAALFSTVE
jgi:hypothetical protein